MSGAGSARPNEAAYAGIGTFAKCPLVLDPAGLRDVDVAVLGVPVDEAVTTRPGARFGPRAIRLADDSGGFPPSRWSMELGIDPFAELAVVDHGDLEVIPGHPEANLARLREWMDAVLGAGVVPVVLGGDHSIAYATIAAAAVRHGRERLGVVQLDAHTDAADPADPWRAPWSHGSPFRRLLDEEHVHGSQLVQLGLRGFWPGPADFAWAREREIAFHPMAELRACGLDAALDATIARLAGLERVWISFDIDSVDPAFAPGTGTPEPGGLASHEALHVVRRLTTSLDLAGFELVEVSPPYDHAGITALLAHRLVLEALAGIALRRSGRAACPERALAPLEPTADVVE